MANLSGLRKFMDNFMQNLLQMGMSLSQARAQAKIWLDNQMKEYAQSLANQKEMEKIRTENDAMLEHKRYLSTIKEKIADPKLSPLERLQSLSDLQKYFPTSDFSDFGFNVPPRTEPLATPPPIPQVPNLLTGPENTWSGTAKTNIPPITALPPSRPLPALSMMMPTQIPEKIVPPSLEQQIADISNIGSQGALARQNYGDLDPKTWAALVQNFGYDKAIQLANEIGLGRETLGSQKLTASGQGLTAAGHALEQKRIDLGYAQIKAGKEGKPGELSDVEKELIDQVDKAQTFLASQQDKWNALSIAEQNIHPGLKPINAELQGAASEYLGGIRSDILSHKPIKPHQIKFLNIVKNAPALAKMGTLTSVLESFLTPPSTAQPQVTPAPTVAAQPEAPPPPPAQPTPTKQLDKFGHYLGEPWEIPSGPLAGTWVYVGNNQWSRKQ